MNVDIRQTILNELSRLHRSEYWLSRRPELTCHEATAYTWLRGEREGIQVTNLQEMFGVLGLRLTKGRRRSESAA